MTLDPCELCRLPDCDERSPRCRVRQLAHSCRSKVKRGRLGEVTELERAASQRLHNIWELERYAEASEGGRPFDRRSAGRNVARAMA